MARKFIAACLLSGLLGIVVLGCSKNTTSDGVRIGATVEEVEKKLGPANAVLPNFGREQRVYKLESGRSAMITFEDGKVVEIHY